MRTRIILVSGVIVTAACHRPPAAGPVATAPQSAIDSCAIGPAGVSPGTLRIAITEPIVAGHPSAATTRAAGLIARHLYEPLVRLTCDGRIVPSLAESWVTTDSGRSWTFTLRPNLRFWEGSGVPPAEVIGSWSGYQTADALVPWAGIQRARVVDDRRLAVYMTGGAPEFPRVLADTRLSLAVRTKVSPWPLGTGPYRPTSEGDSSVTVEAWDSGLRRAPGAPSTIEFHTVSSRSARDMVDENIDLLVSDDSSLLAYSVARNYTSTALAWDRAYVLFVPTTPVMDAPMDGPRAGFLEAIARDAVGAEARVVESVTGWQTEACPSGSSAGVDPINQARRVVYSSEDETAREVAHRLVTYAGSAGQGGEWLMSAFRILTGSRSFPFAVGLEPAAWRKALARGNETAFVIGLPRRGHALCSLPSRTEGAWYPLIETRAHLAVRPGVGGLYADWDGVPHVRDRR